MVVKGDKGEEGILNGDEILSIIGGLINIQDDITRNKQVSEFIQSRVKLLTSTVIPRDFSIISREYKGFLHPRSGIRRMMMMDPFYVDDPEIYTQLINSFTEYKKAPSSKDKTLIELAFYAVNRTVGTYFGNYWGSEQIEATNMGYYMDHSGAVAEDINISNLKGKGVAVCAEKAAVAQNLLTFLGYESELVASSKCKLSEENSEDGHMYVVVKDGEEFLIFDPTNPIFVRNNDESIYTLVPSTYKISRENYTKLMCGGQVEVIHNDYSWDGEKPIKGPDQKRVYGGPSQAMARF